MHRAYHKRISLQDFTRVIATLCRRLTDNALTIVNVPAHGSPSSPSTLLHAPHFHDVCEMKIVLKGTLKCYFPDSAVSLQSGRILIIPPGLLHTGTQVSDLSRGGRWLNVWFERGALGLYLGGKSAKPIYFLTSSQYSQLSTLLQTTPADYCTHLYALAQNGRNPLIQQAWCGLMLTFFSLLAHTILSPEAADGKAEAILSRAMAYMMVMHYDPTLKISDIAKSVNRSSSYLAHLFNQHKRTSLRQMLISLRLKKAYRLLQTGKHTVKEAAYHSGWKNQLYFSARFRKKYGFPPSRIVCVKDR